jgi:hypothetical protein
LLLFLLFRFIHAADAERSSIGRRHPNSAHPSTSTAASTTAVADHRFIHASNAERSSILKMIPHIEVGSWLIKQTVGTTPFIVGRKLETTYHLTDR